MVTDALASSRLSLTDIAILTASFGRSLEYEAWHGTCFVSG
jgi:hypothetical protein